MYFLNVIDILLLFFRDLVFSAAPESLIDVEGGGPFTIIKGSHAKQAYATGTCAPGNPQKT